MTTLTRVAMKQRSQQITELNTSKPWGTFWSSEGDGVAEREGWDRRE